MIEPIIQFYGVDIDTNIEDLDPLPSFQFLSTTGGPVRAGTSSKELRVRIYNDKSNSNDCADATDVDVTIVSGGIVSSDKWCKIKESVSSSYDSEGYGEERVLTLPSISSGNYDSIDMRMDVPAGTPASTYGFYLRVSYTYTA